MTTTLANTSGDTARSEITALGSWFHNLHLPDGTQTFPDHWLGDFPRFKWLQIADSLPSDLSGWTCLDIGTNAGFYAFELARRGGSVLGIDIDDRYLRQARWAAGQFGLQERVRFERMQVYDLARLDLTFDLVLFAGVFYHLRLPNARAGYRLSAQCGVCCCSKPSPCPEIRRSVRRKTPLSMIGG